MRTGSVGAAPATAALVAVLGAAAGRLATGRPVAGWVLVSPEQLDRALYLGAVLFAAWVAWQLWPYLIR